MADRKERGVALLVVLIAVALLTVTVFEFTYRAQVEYRRAVAWVRVRQTRLIADSGVAIAAEMLARAPLLYSLQFAGDEKKADSLGELWAQRCEPEGPDRCPGIASRSCTLDTFDEHRLAVRIIDEAGRYNLNRLVYGSTAERERLARLVGSLGLDAAALGELVQWTSKDSRGASVPFPRRPSDRETAGTFPVRAGALATFGELAFLPGLRARDLIELRRLATVLDSTVNEVNVNTAPLAVLAALHPDLADDALLAQLHAARCQRAIIDETALRAALGASKSLPFESLLAYKSEHFRVEAVGEIDGMYHSVEAGLRRPYEPGNRTEWRVELAYYLPRRGPLIDPAVMQGPSVLGELTESFAAPGGLQ